MIDPTTFSAGLRALVFSQCHHEERAPLADFEVAALDASTIEVSDDDVLGVAKFAGLVLSILHVRNAGQPGPYITKVTPLERGAGISVRWEAVEHQEIFLTGEVELPRTGIRKCAVPRVSTPSHAASSQARRCPMSSAAQMDRTYAALLIGG